MSFSQTRSLRSKIVSRPTPTNMIKVSVNEWLTYHNVRVNNLKFMPGQEVLIVVEPVSHVADGDIRSLEPESRHCRFRDEQQVCSTNFVNN